MFRRTAVRLSRERSQASAMPSSQQFCTFLVDGQMFGTPVARVQEVIQRQVMTPVPLAPEVVTGMINLRGQIVCAMDLRRRLQLPERAADQTPMSVVVRTNQGTVSLLVDEIGDVIEIAEEALESPPETLQGVAREVVEGVYKLPDRLLLALDINRVVEVGERSKTEA
jgi:purine-binding chemotaxis protein CheW